MNKATIWVVGSLLTLGWFSTTESAFAESGEGYAKAFAEFNQQDYAAALKALDAFDAGAARVEEKAESLNLRGVIFLRQHRYHAADLAFQQALELRPHFWNALFNRAEVPFLSHDWSKARERFSALLAQEDASGEEQARQLVHFKIFLTWLMDDNVARAKAMLSETLGAEANYAQAAVAYHRGQPDEAVKALSQVEEKFPPAINQLFAESFYEIGWRKRPEGTERVRFEISAKPSAPSLEESTASQFYAEAEEALDHGDLPGALAALDHRDAVRPHDPAALNLRAEILIRQGKFDQAEAALQEASAADPKFCETLYNRARIALKRQRYVEARDWFEQLYRLTPADPRNQAAQLLRFEVFLTYLLEPNENEAARLMGQFKFTAETPALYYAQAAWAFAHGKRDAGESWLDSAAKIYSPALNLVFHEALSDFGGTIVPEDNRVAEAGRPESERTDQEIASASPSWPEQDLQLRLDPMTFTSGSTSLSSATPQLQTPRTSGPLAFGF